MCRTCKRRRADNSVAASAEEVRGRMRMDLIHGGGRGGARGKGKGYPLSRGVLASAAPVLPACTDTPNCSQLGAVTQAPFPAKAAHQLPRHDGLSGGGGSRCHPNSDPGLPSRRSRNPDSLGSRGRPFPSVVPRPPWLGQETLTPPREPCSPRASPAGKRSSCLTRVRLTSPPSLRKSPDVQQECWGGGEGQGVLSQQPTGVRVRIPVPEAHCRFNPKLGIAFQDQGTSS